MAITSLNAACGDQAFGLVGPSFIGPFGDEGQEPEISNTRGVARMSHVLWGTCT